MKRNPKAEIRNPKEGRNPKCEGANPSCAGPVAQDSEGKTGKWGKVRKSVAPAIPPFFPIFLSSICLSSVPEISSPRVARAEVGFRPSAFFRISDFGFRISAAAIFLTSLLLAAAAAGCVSKSKAAAQAREAFFAGQREAEQRMQRQPQIPNVTILGEVRNHTVPWTEDLTLARALIAAGYSGRADPTDIVIIRNGQGTQVAPQKLLSGEDVPLQAGDVVTIRH
jgi:hypothetical protein